MKFFFGLFFFSLFVAGRAQQIARDNEFAHYEFNGLRGEVSQAVKLSNGKILIAGSFSFFQGRRDHVVRLNEDGTIDETFQAVLNLGLEHGGRTIGVRALAVQTDGRILVGIEGHTDLGSPDRGYRIFRLHPDGAWDNSFTPPGGYESPLILAAFNIIPLIDGKILVSAQLTQEGGVGLLRLENNGTLDSTFDLPINVYCSSVVVVPLSDGKFLVRDCNMGYGLRRLNSDGSIDSSFQPTTSITGPFVFGAVVDRDKIWVRGEFSKVVNGITRKGLIRLEYDGRLDESFIPDARIQSIDRVNDISFDGDNIFLTGLFRINFEPYGAIKIDRNGQLLKSYKFPRIYASAVVPLNDDKLLLSFSDNILSERLPNRFLFRLNPDSSIDPMFYPYTGFNDKVMRVAIQPDGKIIVAGPFNYFNSVKDSFSPTKKEYLTRLNPDGTLDHTFNPPPPVGYLQWTATAIHPLPDGKILIGDYEIKRLHSNGTRDYSFISNFYQSINSIHMKDGKILLGGSNLVRLLADGTEDPEFRKTTLVFYQEIFSLSVSESNGSIVAVGNFSSFDKRAYGGIVRVLADGTIDPAFNTGTGFNRYPRASDIQADGKVIVGGSFSEFNGTPANALARLNADGSLDHTFNIQQNNWLGGEVTQIRVLPNGKILVAGQIRLAQGAMNLVLLDSTGKIEKENSFEFQGNFDTDATPSPPSMIASFSIHDDRLIAVGDFSGITASSNDSFIAAFNIINCKPATIVQPPSDVTTCAGGKAQLQVFALGDNLQYCWKRDTLVVGTASTLTLPSVTQAEAGAYHLTVSGKCGDPLNVSATVSIATPPAILSSQDKVIVCEGDPVSLTIDALGDSLQFQWYKGRPLAGQTDRILNIPVSEINHSGKYHVQVTDKCGNEKWSGVVLNVHPMKSCKSNSTTPLLLFPNPFSTSISVPIDPAYKGRVLIKIVDSFGNEVKSLQYDQDDSEGSLLVEGLGGLLNGEYIIRVQTNKLRTARIFKD